MGAISLKLSNEILEKSAQCAKALKISRAEFMRRAIEKLSRETNSALRAKRMAEVSRRVRKESMRVNAEFAAIEEDPDA